MIREKGSTKVDEKLGGQGGGKKIEGFGRVLGEPMWLVFFGIEML